MPDFSLREAFSRKLVDIGEREPRIVVLDSDVDICTKVDAFACRFPDRFFQIGIAEQNMMGIAGGMAASGFVPITGSLACFASKRALDQIDAAISQPNLNVKIIAAYSGIFTGKTGKSHQAIQDLAIMRSLPNMRVLEPGDADETASALDAMCAYSGPVYMRLARDSYPLLDLPVTPYTWGKPHPLKEGRDLAILSAGIMTHEALKAAWLLEEEGCHCAVVHVSSIKPLDPGAIVNLTSRYRAIVTVENHSVVGGFGSLIAEMTSTECPVRIKMVGINDRYATGGSNSAMSRKYGLDALDIVRACKSALEGSGT